MSNNSRRSKALTILADTGMSRSSYAPPYLRLLWRLGIDIAPPHFMPCWRTFLITGIWFGFSWGAIMSVLFWNQHRLPGQLAAGVSVGAGLFFGLSMAAYYAYGRRKYQLPDWNSI